MTEEIAQDTVVKIDSLSFTYGREKVLDDVTFDIKKGEFLGVIGPNGSGKSTLLRIILGLLKASHGTVNLFGQDIHDFKDWWKIGYVPQRAGSISYHFPVTVKEIVEMGLIGRKTKERGAVSKALEDVEMGGFKERLITELSGGQQQRVFIARALVSNPELIILDEPTSGVDAEAQTSFYKLLKKLNKELNLTLILVSHDIEVVVNEVTTIACLNGKLICYLPPKEFVKKDYLEKIYGQDLKFVVHGH